MHKADRKKQQGFPDPAVECLFFSGGLVLNLALSVYNPDIAVLVLNEQRIWSRSWPSERFR